MPKFKIDSITCLDQQEEGEHGPDEVYFRLFDIYGPTKDYESNKMYGLDENPNAPFHTVYPSEQYEFTGEVKVELWEYDVGSNADELLQSFKVNSNNVYYDFWQNPNALYDVQHSVL